MINFNELTEIIESNNSFLLTTHVNPDADAIGSEIAFYQILKKLKKEIKIINHSAMPYNLQFLDAEYQIEKYEEAKHKKFLFEYDVLVALDFNRADRLVSMQDSFTESNKLKICIDHHQDAELFADHFFTGSDYAATGHIIYDFILKTSIVKMNREIAYPIYAAIMTDTGSFRFERTTPELHGIVADLLNYDIQPSEVFNKLYDESKLSKIKLLGRCLNSLQIIDGKIGYMTITQKDFNELDAIESDTENFVNHILSIEGVKLGLLFIELKNGFKVSFRSKGTLPVNKLAAEFGGGGHLNASGARFRDKQMKEMTPEILNKAKTYSEKHLKEENV
ncbi:MAG: bifunctional oligoribonuclease/PAP phosphatase NrnA [Ignavibacteriaceae bacterium]|nr:bifunctional oligoribonuclease/PAP phosphatase NrnA [Ignavibacteriaceae bacterium]